MQRRTIDIRRRFYAAYRDPNLAVLEGFHPARHALAFGARLDLAVTYDHDRLLELATRLAPDAVESISAVIEVVSPSFFEKMSPRRLSSPLLSITSRPHSDVSRILRPQGKPIIYLERPRDPGNVGAVIRVSAAAAIGGVIVGGDVDPWSPVVIRSATGLQFAIEVGSAELPTAIDRPVVALDAEGEPLTSSSLDVNSVLVVGGERYGLSPRLRGMAQHTVAIPMMAGVSSMNLATALSAVLFSWRETTREQTGAYPW